LKRLVGVVGCLVRPAVVKGEVHDRDSRFKCCLDRVHKSSKSAASTVHRPPSWCQSMQLTSLPLFLSHGRSIRSRFRIFLEIPASKAKESEACEYIYIYISSVLINYTYQEKGLFTLKVAHRLTMGDLRVLYLPWTVDKPHFGQRSTTAP